jgi:hypothetical protein
MGMHGTLLPNVCGGETGWCLKKRIGKRAKRKSGKKKNGRTVCYTFYFSFIV